MGEEEALGNLLSTLEAALCSANAQWAQVGSLCLGLSGVDCAADVAEYTALIRGRLRARCAPEQVRIALVLARRSVSRP